MSVTFSVCANSRLAEFPACETRSIDFGEASALYVPTIGLHRNVVLEQIATRFGTPVDASPRAGCWPPGAADSICRGLICSSCFSCFIGTAFVGIGAFREEVGRCRPESTTGREDTK